jgi:hypothetical protein
MTNIFGYLVIFNTSSPQSRAKDTQLLIRDEEVISASGFED